MFLVLSGLAACKSADNGSSLSVQRRAAIADSLRHMIVAAYDMRDTSGFASRLISLYSDSGRIVSATAGRASASRDTLEQGIRWFWENVGRNMREPRWTWGPMFIDVLSPDAAVVTATYRVPHTTPNGQPHVIGGAWTAVFERRGGRWGIIQEHLSDLPASP
jgi:ketosteroid isomerase-like protein